MADEDAGAATPEEIRRLFDDAEAEAAFVNPIDAFALIHFATGFYVTDDDKLGSTKDRREAMAAELAESFAEIMNKHKATRGEEAFILTFLASSLVTMWNLNPPDTLGSMLPKAREYLMNKLMIQYLPDILAGDIFAGPK